MFHHGQDTRGSFPLTSPGRRGWPGEQCHALTCPGHLHSPTCLARGLGAHFKALVLRSGRVVAAILVLGDVGGIPVLQNCLFILGQ